MQPEQPIYQQSIHDPGKTLGIVGFIIAFVGVPLIGLILSIIGYHRSKVAGFKNGLAIAGIVVNGVFLLLFTTIAVAIIITAYGGITERANTNKGLTTAATVQKVAEAFYADTERYPDSITDFYSGNVIVLPSTISILTSSQTLNETNGLSSVVYQYIGEQGKATGGRIVYWDFTTDTISTNSIYVGAASLTDSYTDFQSVK